MEPGSSDPPRELDDLSPPAVANFGAVQNPGSSESRSSTPQGRPKVRFNSNIDLPALAAEAAKASGEQHRSASSKPPVLRPALSRNLSSFNSTASDVDDEPLGPAKRASAAAAAERARVVALDTWHHSNNPENRENRWSIDSGAITDASYSEVPIASSYAPQAGHEHVTSSNHNDKFEVEAKGLFKAHTQNLGSALHSISGMMSKYR